MPLSPVVHAVVLGVVKVLVPETLVPAFRSQLDVQLDADMSVARQVTLLRLLQPENMPL